MKIIVIIIVLELLFIGVFAQEAVRFEKLTLKKALKKAQKENKPVFLDCHVFSCISCKKMDTNVFKHPEAAEFLNSNFICVKSDMENKKELEILKNYGVQTCHSFLLVNPNGKVACLFQCEANFEELKQKIIMGLLSGKDFVKAFAKGDLSKEEILHLEELCGKEYLNNRFLKFYNDLCLSYIAGYNYLSDSTIAQPSLGLIREQIKKLKIPEKQHLMELKFELAEARCSLNFERMIVVGEEILSISIADEEDWRGAALFFLTIDVRSDQYLMDRIVRLERMFMEKLREEEIRMMVKHGFGRNVLQIAN